MGEVFSLDQEWSPDWAIHPGEYLEEHLEEREMSQAEFSRLSGLSPKLISTLISGSNPVTAETALRLENVLGVKAYIWTGMQSAWDIQKARESRVGELSEEQKSFLNILPTNEILKRFGGGGVKTDWEKYSLLLKFASIGDMNAWDARCQNLAVNHRKAKKGTSDDNYISCWLLLGEHKARQMSLPQYNRGKFVEAVREIRKLTVLGPEKFELDMKRLCREAGVALIFEKPLPKTLLFGSARWLDTGNPVIQMSLRMKFNDHFWWTFFHECGHVLLHEGQTFADDKSSEENSKELEADLFSKETLVGNERFKVFALTKPRTKAQVKSFARSCGVHPGIVVGMLQHERVVPFTHMNDLKTQFEWRH